MKSIEVQLKDKSLSEQQLFLQIQKANEQLFTFTRRLIDKARPELIALATTLDKRQKAQLITALKKNNEKTSKRFAKLKTVSSQKSEYRKNFQEQLRERFGKLTKEQSQQLNQWQKAIIPAYRQQLEARQEWTRQLEVALSDSSIPLAFLMSPDRPWQSSEFKRLIIHNRTLSEEFVAYMLATRTPKQQKNLLKELSKLIRSLESLKSK